MEAVRDASGCYDFDAAHFGAPLSWWVRELHRYDSDVNCRETPSLETGSFGYSHYACCAEFGLRVMRIECINTKDKIAAAIFEGWKYNYIYWRDNQPWSNEFQGACGYRYIAPHRSFDDKTRDIDSRFYYDELSESSKLKSVRLAEGLISSFNKLRNN